MTKVSCLPPDASGYSRPARRCWCEASFDYRRGEWMGLEIAWSDARRALTLRLASASRMLAPLRRVLTVKLGDITREAVFQGRPMEVRF